MMHGREKSDPVIVAMKSPNKTGGPAAEARERRAGALAEPWADTVTSTGRLMIAVLGGLADVERDLIRTRTAEGRNCAKARGQHMGRPRPLPRSSKPRRGSGARRARPSGSWRRA